MTTLRLGNNGDLLLQPFYRDEESLADSYWMLSVIPVMEGERAEA